jgi:hypothetical protein
MQFYQRIEALNDQTHAGLRMRALNHFRYAARTNAVPVLLGEVSECVRHYPVVFATGERGLLPVALLGLRDDENLFVDADGRWREGYVPAFVRRYPFISAEDGRGQRIACIDAAASCFGGSEGEPLFVDGKPGAALTHALQFLNEFQAGSDRTEAATAIIGRLALLRSADSLAQLNGGRQFRLSGLMVIDEERFAALSDTSLGELHRVGALQLIHLHLHSLGRLGALTDRLSARIGTGRPTTARRT